MLGPDSLTRFTWPYLHPGSRSVAYISCPRQSRLPSPGEHFDQNEATEQRAATAQYNKVAVVGLTTHNSFVMY